MIKTILLGTGYTLEYVGAKLPKGNFVATSRDPEKIERFNKNNWKTEDLSKLSFLDLFSRYPDIENVVDSIPPGKTQVFPQIKIIEALKTLKNLKRVIYLSTTGVYGVTDGSWVDEKTETKPDTPTGKARLEVEELYYNAGLPITILRLPAIYGADRGINGSLQNGSYKYVNNGERFTNRIHVEDLSDIIVRALNIEILPRLLCVSDGEPALAKEVVQYYCEKLNLPLPESISLEEAKAQKLYTMLSNQRVRNKLLKQTFGDLSFANYKM